MFTPRAKANWILARAVPVNAGNIPVAAIIPPRRDVQAVLPASKDGLDTTCRAHVEVSAALDGVAGQEVEEGSGMSMVRVISSNAIGRFSIAKGERREQKTPTAISAEEDCAV